MIRVAYIAGEPTASRVPQMDLLAAAPGVDLTSIYAAHALQGRNWTLSHTHRTIFLRGVALPLAWLLHHDYPITPSIVRILRRERFDVLIIGGWSVFACQVAVVWARLTGTPYLLFSENHDREERPRWIAALRRLVLPHVVGAAAGNLVPGSLAARHVERFGADPRTTTIFPNTVDVTTLSALAADAARRRSSIRKRLAIPEDAFVVIQVSRLIPVKAIDVTIDAVAVAAAATDRTLVLLLVGDGPERPALEERASRAAIDARFLGFLEGDELVDAYVAADVATLLSRRETWGVVVNEAMACGLPVIASDRVGAAADLVRSGETGFVVARDDGNAVAGALLSLAGSSETRARFGERSLELIQPWGYERGVRDVVAVLEALPPARRGRYFVKRA